MSFELYLQKPITATNEILKEKLEICKPWKHSRNKYKNQTDSSLKCLRLWRAHGEKLKSLSALFGRYVFFSDRPVLFLGEFSKNRLHPKSGFRKSTAPYAGRHKKIAWAAKISMLCFFLAALSNSSRALQEEQLFYLINLRAINHYLNTFQLCFRYFEKLSNKGKTREVRFFENWKDYLKSSW